MVIQHNMSAAGALRQYGINQSDSQSFMEKLSSGYRINRAADDAAGLSISEKMRSQIRGLSQASANCMDGISMVQVADGALNEVHNMLQRMNELSVQSANGTLSESDRMAVDSEVQQLICQIDQMAAATKFNETGIFPKDGCVVADGYFPQYDDDESLGLALYERITNDLTPNSVSQILSAFPTLDAATGGDVPIDLQFEYIDGPGSTLAFARFSGAHNSTAFVSKTFSMHVDEDDYDIENGYFTGGHGSQAEMLESTIAHELTHTIMQNVFPFEMTGASSVPGRTFPSWFVEGVAQLSGGGFTTGWNDYLMNAYINGLSSENDSSKDSLISSYLSDPSRNCVTGVNGKDPNVYGQGYLACAYLGYLASGSGTISSQSIASGIDKIFGAILNNPGMSLENAINSVLPGANTLTTALNDINGGSVKGTEFVRRLCYLSRGGAGSVIASSLSTGGTDIIGSSASEKQKYYIASSNKSTSEAPKEEESVYDVPSGYRYVDIQAGTDAQNANKIRVNLYRMDSGALGLRGVNTRTESSSLHAINCIDVALHRTSMVRSYFGAIQNRLEHTVDNLNNVVENTENAESRIRDTDMAEEMVRYSAKNILLQSGQTILAQANQQTQGILGLLQ